MLYNFSETSSAVEFFLNEETNFDIELELQAELEIELEFDSCV